MSGYPSPSDLPGLKTNLLEPLTVLECGLIFTLSGVAQRRTMRFRSRPRARILSTPIHTGASRDKGSTLGVLFSVNYLFPSVLCRAYRLSPVFPEKTRYTRCMTYPSQCPTIALETRVELITRPTPAPDAPSLSRFGSELGRSGDTAFTLPRTSSPP